VWAPPTPARRGNFRRHPHTLQEPKLSSSGDHDGLRINPIREPIRETHLADHEPPSRTPGPKGPRSVEVAFVATDVVADSGRLCDWLHDEIERHLRSIDEMPVGGWNLLARIERCRMAPNFGEVRVAVCGEIDGRPLDELIAVDDRPAPAGFTLKEQLDKATKTAFANLCTSLGRLLFPSRLVLALGNRRHSGRLVRAWHDCCREIRIRIDRAVARPDSGGGRMLRRTMGTAVRAGLSFTALAAAHKLLLAPRHADEFRAWLACGMIGVGVFGAIAASGLLMLPDRFFQSERQGLELVRLFGVKSLAGIRAVAFGLLSIALIFALAPGLWWLFFG